MQICMLRNINLRNLQISKQKKSLKYVQAVYANDSFVMRGVYIRGFG